MYSPTTISLRRAAQIRMHMVLIEILPLARLDWFYSALTNIEEDALEAICDMVHIHPLDEWYSSYEELVRTRTSLILLYESL